MASDRTAILAPLGLQRLRLLDCLGGNTHGAPGYFEPELRADIFAQFRGYALQMSQRWESEVDPTTISLLAAARFLSGDPGAARVIVENLPAEPPQLDHGAGICRVAPFHALSAALPLPTELKETRRWRAGSREQTALRAWLDANVGRLRWSEREAIYELGSVGGGSAPAGEHGEDS